MPAALPSASVFIYPLVDYRCEGDSYRVRDRMRNLGETMLWFRKYYLRDEADQKDWRASPLWPLICRSATGPCRHRGMRRLAG